MITKFINKLVFLCLLVCVFACDETLDTSVVIPEEINLTVELPPEVQAIQRRDREGNVLLNSGRFGLRVNDLALLRWNNENVVKSTWTFDNTPNVADGSKYVIFTDEAGVSLETNVVENERSVFVKAILRTLLCEEIDDCPIEMEAISQEDGFSVLLKLTLEFESGILDERLITVGVIR